MPHFWYAKKDKNTDRSMNHELFHRIRRILTVLAGLVAFVCLMIWIGKLQDQANAPQLLAVPVSESDWSQGGIDAPVTIVEYSDFQCPACSLYAPVINELGTIFGDQIQLIYRNYPLSSIHNNAQLAAQAAEASGLQGKFFEMHDLLFSRQDAWSDLADPTETFVSYANELELDLDRFKVDLVSAEVKQAILADIDSGNASNISGTPTFFLNGVEIDNPMGVEPFAALINDAIAKQSGTENATQ